MRSPAVSRNRARTDIAYSPSQVAPIYGWNAVDPVVLLKEGEALVLDNWFPRESWVETRKGCMDHLTGMVADAETLLPYNGASPKLFVGTNQGIFDASISGAAGAAVIAMTDGHIQHTNFSTQAGVFLVGVNGVDDQVLFNGTTWQSVNAASVPIAITGIATSEFVHVCSFKRRLFYVLRNSLSAAYLPVATLGGVATAFPLEGIFSKGGTLTAIETWTVDSGSGIDDRIVFITSEGEVAVYQGTDPATDFQLVGVYTLGKPMSRKCTTKFGGDVLLALRDGIYPLSVALQSSTVARSSPVTSKINNAWQDAARTYGESYGWMLNWFTEGPFLVCNIPQGTAASVQYIMNSKTRAWCRFTGMGGVDWQVWDGRLFTCRERKVVEAWVGTSDYTANITYKAKTGYSDFGLTQVNKRWTAIRPFLELSDNINIRVGVDVDFADSNLSGIVQGSVAGQSRWDEALWDDGLWAYDSYIKQDWIGISASPGYYAATKLQVESRTLDAKWYSTKYLLQPGGFI